MNSKISANHELQLNPGEESYNFKKDMILKTIKDQTYWPEYVPARDNWKKFHYADDYSYCGFVET